MLVCCSQPWRHMSLWTELQLNYIFCFLLSLETFLIQTNLSRFSQFIKRSVSLGAASSPVFSILVKRLCLYQSLLNLNKDLISVYWLVGCKCPGNLHFLQLLWHWKVQSQYGLIQVFELDVPFFCRRKVCTCMIRGGRNNIIAALEST